MKKERRILKGIEFQKIIENKKFVVNQSFVIYYCKKQEKHARIGISIGKRLGKAVQRNKVKRQVRMMFQDILDKSLNNDMICIVRAGYYQHTFSENKKLLENLVFKVNIVDDES